MWNANTLLTDYFVSKFALKTALSLLKPGTRDPKLDPFQGFSI